MGKVKGKLSNTSLVPCATAHSTDWYPAVSPAVGSTSWIIPTTLSLEHTKNDPTKHEQLWSRLCELARKPNYFLVG
jgi:hypothetical protein